MAQGQVHLDAAGGGRVVHDLALSDGRLAVARTAGPLQGRTEGAVAWVCTSGGEGRLAVDDEAIDVASRGTVFDAPGASAYVAPGSTFAIDGDVEAVIVWRTWPRQETSRLLDAAEVVEEDRGSGASARRVRTYLPQGPLIAGETLNPPGGWSSYPPHRHEHEEVYVYRFAPAGGFGVAVNYDTDGDSARIVRDGDVQRIARGYHPVVAAPGYAMYYLWALAGESERLTPELDPAHAWANG